MSRASYFRHKKKLEEKKLKRLYEIAKIGFQDQHLERIDIYEMGFKMMWENVRLEEDPYKRNSMIKDILLLQPYLSAYYEATKLVIYKQQQSEYQEFLDKQQEQQQQQQPIKQEEKITKFKQQIHDEQENSRNYDDDDYEEEEFNNNNNNINAKF
jgi:hypothetical protein